ncbi:NADP-dependent oxidoreductase [Actinomadura madurae]|uniref:NADP-dependent oxidoreductase n=1 Tax=Actinomadura madurae TaxID=1993 RepID=UPI002026A4CF|nr:NADP-dependent oxidoreductase [Actinomadura madurae]MCP9950119.1 NADP-dependent oxidoreductase [Actinomadura madurae]MCP9966881.1 NADP-dependent oxidoreductase [Actinomadura madurae]MCP9979365.1 NADP-dependent oxidoreductase [Actinomadura madurae]MCQ0009112.1 NADP-dependent oxidoreductase [Actinomadura madurae]URM95682.1 NADP-dependent oxidoreductase [Actinomadura madurae]
MKAVRFHEYGGIDVLRVEEVERPEPGPGQVLVKVRAAGIQPGEAHIRTGALHGRWPATFPSGQGSDLAGVVVEVGPHVRGVAVGDEVLGFTHNRASHAEFVVVDDVRMTPRPDGLSWDVAGALYVAGTTAYATVFAVDPGPSDTVVVSGAAGGVGSIAVQLVRRRGATVIGLASEPKHAWLKDHGVIPVEYGEGVADRIRQASAGSIDAFIDTFGDGYVDLAVELGVRPERINTIRDWAAAGKVGARTDGEGTAACAVVLGELARLATRGELNVPIASTYPLEQVQDAFRELEHRHTHGKIVLRP